ncbi:MAG: prolyl oligopeptidase family serine peptidase [Terriglobales bacterium]
MRKLICSVIVLGLLILPVAASAQHPTDTAAIDKVLRELSTVHWFAQTAISPDGRRVAWVERKPGGRGTQIYATDVNGSARPRQISIAEDANNSQVVWSPDGKQIAFLSDAAKAGQQQLYVADIASGTPLKITDLTGYLTTPSWSPDGKQLAFLFIEDSPRAGGPLQPMTPAVGVIEERIYEQRLNVVAAEGGAVRAISPADMYVYEYDWAPDGSGFAAIAAPGDGDNSWWIAQLYSLTPDGNMRSIYKPKLQIANPRISPEGKYVAFIEGLMSDQGVTGGDVYLLERSSGTVRNLTPGMQASATWLSWSVPGQIVFTEITDGHAGVATVDTTGKLEQIWSGPEVLTANRWEVSLSLARDGKQSAMVRSSAQRPPEVWAGPIGKWRQITSENGQVKPLWGEQRSVHWQSEGTRVQGWLLFPQKYNPAKRYPLIVDVHGGPASACTAGWPASEAPLAASGYFVLCPNPRGSFGQGAQFAQANVKDFGGGDLRDILAGVEAVLRELPVDPKRLGIRGWSYGGYMTMWAETQTQRFRAAVAGAGIANWLSYYGQNSIDQWMIPFFGASVYDDPQVYAKSAPINFVKNVKTPTLILAGERDGECPAPQSFEWWHALKTFKVPVQFVIYEDEGHMIQKPEHRRDIVVRTIQWFDKWLAAAAQ